MPRRRPDAIDRAIGANIQYWRIARGLTLLQLGAALGVSYQQIQKYERGASSLYVSRLPELARVLRVSVSQLMQGVAMAADG